MARRYNPKRAKTHYSYRIDEAADLHGVHRSTVRHWIDMGLKPLDNVRPVLIHGAELNRFHASLRTTRSQKCEPGELFCLACRAPRHPAGSMADLVVDGGTTSALIGICPVCSRLMHQRVGTRRLVAHRAVLEITDRPRSEPLKGSRHCH